MGKNKYYCRINGRIENLEDVQKVLDGIDTQNDITQIMFKNHGFEALDALLFEDVVKFNNNEIPADYNECLARMRESNSRRVNANLILCPNCRSSNVQKISTGRKLAGAIGFGLFSKTATSQYECLKCKYKW